MNWGRALHLEQALCALGLALPVCAPRHPPLCLFFFVKWEKALAEESGCQAQVSAVSSSGALPYRCPRHWLFYCLQNGNGKAPLAYSKGCRKDRTV